ncbi:MAG: carbohydrate kinase, partial [Clostridia bacterium]|nr:carbohydrate kinase [Clostridia bacterium]
MIVSVGEILADMMGVTRGGETTYQQKAGGAPFNLSCAIKKLGGEVKFVGAVGNDLVGKF